MHFSAASDLLATGCRDKTARVFSVTVPSAEPLISFAGLRDCVHSVKFANDDRELLVAYSDAPGLSVLDVRSGQEARHIDLPSKVRALDLSYEGGSAQTVTIACGREVRVLEGPSLTKRASVTLENPVASASLSPDGQSVVAGGEDMWAYLMDVSSGKVKQVCNPTVPRSACSGCQIDPRPQIPKVSACGRAWSHLAHACLSQ